MIALAITMHAIKEKEVTHRSRVDARVHESPKLGSVDMSERQLTTAGSNSMVDFRAVYLQKVPKVDTNLKVLRSIQFIYKHYTNLAVHLV